MTTTALKLFALVLMFIDHIGEFIPGMPVYLRWIGRLSMPIFVYCMAWGFHYTHNRKIYMFRMYICSAFMGFLDVYLNGLYPFSDSYCTNNIFTSMFLIAVCIFIWDNAGNRKKDKLKAVAIILLFQFSTEVVGLVLDNVCASLIGRMRDTYLVLKALFPNVLTCEGSFTAVVMGIGIYYCMENKQKLTKFYLIFCAADLALMLVMDGSAVFLGTIPLLDYLFKINYQWLQVFALPFMLLYNGEKGKGLKYLFYAFYPAHIAVLFLLGNMLA